MVLFLGLGLLGVASAEEGVRRVKVLNYPDCVELSNGKTTVVLGQHVGGRVLKYSFDGKEALYLDPREAEWGTPEARKRPRATAGRFDIGPEYIVPRHDLLWSGAWKVEVTGPRAARMTSQMDPATGVILVRDFVLAANSSHLSCRQTIRNVSKEIVRWCHWSRTFAKGGGIAVVPIDAQPRRLPKGYVMYPDRGHINFQPEDEMIRRRGNYLEVLGPPKHAKLGMDARDGWVGYQMKHDLLFVKRFAVYSKRAYSEIAGFNLSIWYPGPTSIPAVELEPIGPEEEIAPGESASFTEHWWLLAHEFPAEGTALNLEVIEKRVQEECVVK